MAGLKTHSGAKKRFRLLVGGKIKRRRAGLRHLNVHISSKVKRKLGKGTYVHGANYAHMRDLLINH